MIIDTDSISLDELAALTVRRMPWPEFWAEIRPALQRPMVSLKHERKVSQVIRELEALGIETTADLNLALVGRYIASRPDGQSAWTLKGHLQIIATICNMAVRARVLTVSPFATRPICKLVRTGPPEGKRHYSLDEIRRLLELLQADVNAKKGWPAWRARRLQAVAATAVYCGLRTTELLRLHAADLDFDRHVVRVVPRGSRGMGLDQRRRQARRHATCPRADPTILAGMATVRPGGAGREVPPGRVDAVLVPLHAPAMEAMDGRAAGREAPRPACRRRPTCGDPDLTFHGLRRSLATAMEAFGIGPAMIQRTLRHSRAQTTELHYRKADEVDIARAVRDIRFDQ